MRKFIDFTIDKLGKIKKGQKKNFLPDNLDGYVKVNLGAGLRVYKGWSNIDGRSNAMISSWPSFFHRLAYRFSGSRNYFTLDEHCKILKENKFTYHDLSLSLPIYENTVDFIYSSHFFEHIFKDDALVLLKSCLFELKLGGIIRISIPDLEYAISLYSKGKKELMLENYFFVKGKGSYLARHKYMYDFQMIKEVLELVGFSNAKRCEYQKGKTPDINYLDTYPDISLYVEAERVKSS